MMAGLRAVDPGPFDPRTIEELPAILPLFPLTGALLLPGIDLPLNVFEPRYLALTRAVLASPGRLIGIIQPAEAGADRNLDPGFLPELRRLGCAGRLTSFQETAEGRYRIEISGLIRFRFIEELTPDPAGFRRIRPDFAPYAGDLVARSFRLSDRRAFLAGLRRYLAAIAAKVEWAPIEAMPDAALILNLAEAAPLSAVEKQTLLESADLADFAGKLQALFEIHGRLAEGGRQSLH